MRISKKTVAAKAAKKSAYDKPFGAGDGSTRLAAGQASSKELARASVKPGVTPSLVRGMKDILPVEQKYWSFLRSAADTISNAYSFERIDTPILEETSLFARSVGKGTDIVEKEMFSFIDQGGESLTLRPEATAPIARAYINHGMTNLPQPVKLWYMGMMFRRERPQAGRHREFHQYGAEIMGEAKPVVDAELILVAMRFLNELGIEARVEINSIGHSECRAAYKTNLVSYYRSKRAYICEDCKIRLQKNPLRVLDCKNSECQPVKAGAPQILDWICEECKDHFMRVLEYLDDADIPYVLNQHLVRGFDYYSMTVFEFYAKEKPRTEITSPPTIGPASPAGAEGESLEEQETRTAQSALGGGGRYDGLIELLGGRPTPACGFAMGLERIINVIKERSLPVPEIRKPAVFFAQLGVHARRRAMRLFEELRRAGISSAVNFSKESLKSQMELANNLGVRYVLILGQKEVLDETIILRDMESGVQEVLDQKKIVIELHKKLTK